MQPESQGLRGPVSESLFDYGRLREARNSISCEPRPEDALHP